MARYLVLEKSHIGGRIVEPGDEVEYAGEPDGNLQPLDEEGKVASAARAAKIAEAKAKAEAHARFVENLKKGGGIDDLV